MIFLDLVGWLALLLIFFFFFLIKTWEYGMPQGRGFNVAILLKGARMRPDAWFCVWKQTTWVVI